MIFDKIDNLSTYRGISKNLDTAIEYLLNTNFEKVADGKYEVDGREVHVTISTYETKVEADAKTETHDNYIDIQYIIEGEECMKYAPKSECLPLVPYNSDKDVEFFTCEEMLELKVSAGKYAIFFPQDAHKPAYNHETTKVRKVLVKIKIN
ncbi:MAG: YhcH/YjgK/YiaL family protein [Clostridia bacterium]|nr:YhcH/YjgK/YiaL family protein [Clostridia bacterium]